MDTPGKSTDQIVEVVEAEVQPSLFEAELDEYFLSMPFDERLFDKLSNTPYGVNVEKFEGNTTLLVREPFITFFPDNNRAPIETRRTLAEGAFPLLDIDVPSFSFLANGKISSATNDARHLDVNITIHSELQDDAPVEIHDVVEEDGQFIISKSGKEGVLSERINSRGLLALIGGLAELDGVDLNPRAKVISIFSKEELANPEAEDSAKEPIERNYNKEIIDLWQEIGEEQESLVVSHELERQVLDTPDKTETIHLSYNQIENSKGSFFHLFLDFTTHYPTLDVEDDYRLELLYKYRDPYEQDAERTITSGALPLELSLSTVDAFHHGPKKTKLDIGDPATRELFVNWFDELFQERTTTLVSL